MNPNGVAIVGIIGMLLVLWTSKCEGEDLRGTVGNACKPDGTCVGKLVCRLGERNGSISSFYGCDVPNGP